MTDPSAQSLYLTRHGQTALNAAGRLRGLADPPLDDVGIVEARRLGRALANTGAQLVVSSPLERARHTAQIVAQIVGTRHLVDERFNDRDYGPQTGLVKSEVEAQWGSVDNAPGVEPVDSVLARARPALDDLLNQDGTSTVIVVTHDALIRPLIATIDPGYEHLQAPTGSWNHLHRAAGLWSIVAVDQLPSAEADHV